ncbi:neuropathy target esterase sws isoform X3 [Folsomia candida]|uniref:neuropathy target esterase sws isoform X3 n=1 Tax=Folsomia candida TaxID=158441 RepID=UPI000B8FA408|nr:neuropathy target esterase sws isoform X3 [Folsomia candida]
MRIDSVLQLAVSRFYKVLPHWEHAGVLWCWWIVRKCIFYGTCIYIAETVLGQRRRPYGSSPLRELGYYRWLPKNTVKEIDEETRLFLKHLGYNIPLRTQVRKGSTGNNVNKATQFYADVPFQPPLTPIVDDDPMAPVEGETFPLGFYVVRKTLRILGYFPAKYCIKIWRSCEVVNLKEGELACDFGEVDNYFLVVLSGSLTVSIQDEEFGHVQINTVTENQHVLSMFVITNYVLGVRVDPKPVQVCADEDSVVVKISHEAIKRYFWEDAPHDLIPFARRMLTKIRGLYFEGVAEVAGLNKQIMVGSLGVSQYEPFDDAMGDAKNVSRMIQEAREGLSKYGLVLADEDIPHCNIGAVESGCTITTVGVRLNSLIYVYKGEMAMINYSTLESRSTTVSKELDKERNKKFIKFEDHFSPLFFLSEGSVLGAWGLITNSSNYYSAMVPKGQKAIVFEVPGRIVKKHWNKDPLTMMPLLRSMLKRWSNFAKKIDYCLQWSFIAPGKIVYRKGDAKISTFLVLSGRLRYKVHGHYMYEKRTELEARSKFGHYEAGDWFGFVECAINSVEMQKTVIADRYSEIVTLPSDLITLLYQRFPGVIATMTNYLSIRIHKDYHYDEINPPKERYGLDTFTCPKYALERKPPCSILAVFPLRNDIPGEFYCHEICRHYSQPAKFVTYDCFREKFGTDPGQENVNKLTEWITYLEFKFELDNLGIIVMLGNADEVDLWNTFLAREADFIQLLGTNECPIKPTRLEKMVEVEGWKAIRSFVMLHPSQFELYPKHPESTPRLSCPLPYASCLWLNRRPWLDMHHHVRFPICAFQFMKSLKKCYFDEFEDYKQKIGVDKYSDVARVGRWLSNSMVGIVLGGGGAKGAAHLGILEFIMQLDLPIDYICGVSIGAFVGGVWALHQDLDKVEDRVRKLLKELETPSRYSSDMTVPYSSMYTGQCFDEFVQSTFNDVRMEDLWVPFFPVTTDISGLHSRAHKHGQMWFYVRASMTLTMVFPPLINPRDDHLIMDGGYSEILPGLKKQTIKKQHFIYNQNAKCMPTNIHVLTKVASDIGDQNGIPLFNIGYECSGIKCIWQNSMPTNHWPKVPSKMAFWEQLNYIAARKYVHLLTRKDKRLVYIRPAIEFYNGRDFEKTEEIKMMSFYTTKKRFGAVRAGLPPNMMWACLNARLRDYDGTSSDENNLIYQAQTYNFVPDSDGSMISPTASDRSEQ